MSDRDLVALVKALPEETPSLAWRSALNEKIRAESKGRARRRLFGFWTGGLATAGVATMLAVVLVTPSSMVSPPSGVVRGNKPATTQVAPDSALARDLVAIHTEGEALADVSNSGPAAPEADLSPREIDEAIVSGLL